ncbi:hypothetical protein D3C81_1581330 [compost metagenome]
MQRLPDPPTDVLGDARGAAGEMRAVGDVQIGLVQRQRLDLLGVVAEDRVDFPRHSFIDIHARPHDGQVRTQLDRRAHRHRRMQAVDARLVVAGGDHPALVRRTADGQRLADQARIVAHLDGGVEAVAIYVDDLSLGHGGRRSGRAGVGRRMERCIILQSVPAAVAG